MDENSEDNTIPVSLSTENNKMENHPLQCEDAQESSDGNANIVLNDNKSWLKICFPAFILGFQIFGCGLYSTDVITDILTGASFISGKSIEWKTMENDNYTVSFCDEFDTYSHEIWGSLCIVLAWTPAIALLPPLISFWKKLYSGSLRGRDASSDSWIKTTAISISLITFWPVTGILMCLRKFPKVENFYKSYIFPRSFFERTKHHFESELVRILEGCIEAPFQLTLQLYASLAGIYPGTIQKLSMFASLVSIIFQVELGNGFIVLDGLDSKDKVIKMASRGIKMAVLILMSTVFRTLSLVTMAILVRQYTIIPIVIMIILQCLITKKIIGGVGNTGDFLLTFIPYAVIPLVSVAILPPVKSECREDEKERNRIRRKKWFLYDSIATFVVYGSTLFVIIMIWWLNASILKQNLNGCFVGFVTDNVNKVDNVIIICASLLALGISHCISCAGYYTWNIGF